MKTWHARLPGPESTSSVITRRDMSAAMLTCSLAAAASPSRLSLQGYIWINLANRAKKPLASMMDELFESAPFGGFENIELSDWYFTPELKDKTLALVERHRLRMPSVYAGGAMHETDLADATIAKAVSTANTCKPYRCTALVHNPNPKPKGAAKTDSELDLQAAALNRMGAALARDGFQLRVHHHSPEMENDAREWRHILRHTDPSLVTLCIDVEFVYRGGIDPSALIREAGARVTELHLRNRTNNSPLQAFEPGDIDYAKVARTVAELRLKPLVVVELAYHDDTIINRPFGENVRRSRQYAAKLFGL